MFSWYLHTLKIFTIILLFLLACDLTALCLNSGKK